MRALLPFGFLLLAVVAPDAQAQDADRQAGGVAGIQEPASSQVQSNPFEVLPLIVKVGQEVKVRGEAGRATRGKVVSISSNQLVVARSRRFRSRVEQLFAQDAIRTIEAVDSHWNGALFGVAASVGIFVVTTRACARKPDTGVCQGVVAPASLATVLAPFIGWGIDDSINTTIYERPSQTPSRITLAPLLGRERIGVTAQVSF